MSLCVAVFSERVSTVTLTTEGSGHKSLSVHAGFLPLWLHDEYHPLVGELLQSLYDNGFGRNWPEWQRQAIGRSIESTGSSPRTGCSGMAAGLGELLGDYA